MAYSEKIFKYTRSRFQIDVLAHVDEPAITIKKKAWGVTPFPDHLFRKLPNIEIVGDPPLNIEIMVRYDKADEDEATNREKRLTLFYFIKAQTEWKAIARLTSTGWARVGSRPGNITAVRGVNGILIVTATSWPDPPLGWGFS